MDKLVLTAFGASGTGTSLTGFDFSVSLYIIRIKPKKNGIHR